MLIVIELMRCDSGVGLCGSDFDLEQDCAALAECLQILIFSS